MRSLVAIHLIRQLRELVDLTLYHTDVYHMTEG